MNFGRILYIMIEVIALFSFKQVRPAHNSNNYSCGEYYFLTAWVHFGIDKH